MTNQLSHSNLFSDLSNVTLCRVFRTDQGWIMEAHGQNSASCPGCQSISRSRQRTGEIIAAVGHALGGRPGQRLMSRLGMPVSADTLIRQVAERYILGGDNITLQQILGEIADLPGRRPPSVKLPLWPLFPLAHAAEAVAQLTGKEPFVTVVGLQMAKNRMFFSWPRPNGNRVIAQRRI
jgi:hypothetical protein